MKAFRPMWLLIVGLLAVPATDAGASKTMLQGAGVVHQVLPLLLPAQIQQYFVQAAEPTKLLFLGGIFVLIAMLLRHRLMEASNDPSL